MTRKWELTRDEAEYLVDVLASVLEEGQSIGLSGRGREMAEDLAAELCDLFGMGLLKQEITAKVGKSLDCSLADIWQGGKT
jgi:hypothetical protein